MVGLRVNERDVIGMNGFVLRVNDDREAKNVMALLASYNYLFSSECTLRQIQPLNT